jgi:hypothetical protein
VTTFPLYEHRKRVRAAKIIGITGPAGFHDGHAELVTDIQDLTCHPGAGHITVSVGPGWLDKNPMLAAGGYLVEEEGGSMFFVPTSIFEDRFIPVPPETQSP